MIMLCYFSVFFWSSLLVFDVFEFDLPEILLSTILLKLITRSDGFLTIFSLSSFHIWIFLIILDIPYLCLRRYSFLLRFSFPFLASDILCRLYFLMICRNRFSEMLLFWKVIWFERLDINSFSLLVGFLQTFFTFAFIVR